MREQDCTRTDEGEWYIGGEQHADYTYMGRN